MACLTVYHLPKYLTTSSSGTVSVQAETETIVKQLKEKLLIENISSYYS